jgi:phosphoribosylformylglycinamidine synthase
VGLLKNVNRMATIAFKRQGDVVILIGDTKGHLGQSIYLREIEGMETGAAPPVDLAIEKKNGDFVRTLISAGRADTVHDLSDGGLLVALAEMALPARVGVKIVMPGASDAISYLYGEDQARYLLAVPAADKDRILTDAKASGASAILLGTTGGDRIAVEGSGEIAIAALARAHEGWFPNYMGGTELPPSN